MLGCDGAIGRGGPALSSVWFSCWTAGEPTWSKPSLMIHADGPAAPEPEASTLTHLAALIQRIVDSLPTAAQPEFRNDEWTFLLDRNRFRRMP